MALQFIDQSISGIGHSDRRIIRSHVMRGKNAGKQRRSTKKQKNILEPKSLLHAPGSGYTIPRQVLWSDLCVTSFPEELSSQSMGLMHRWFFDISDTLFPPQFCSKFDIVRSIWVNCILADEASPLTTRFPDFHSTLAISASYVDFFQRKPATSQKNLHHISKAYALVNVKLSGPFPVSDSAIAAVVSLAIYQQIHHQPAIGIVHLHGLYRMIQLRGGIDKVMQENRSLAMKPLRLDVELAMQNGTPTLFRSNEVPIRSILCDSIASGPSPTASSWMPLIMLDLLNFANLLNAIEKRPESKLDPLDYTETLLSLLYRLVDVSIPTETPTNPEGLHENVKYLAMLSFMTTLLPEFTSDGPNFPLLSERLKKAIQDLCIMTSEGADYNSPLMLWTFFMSAISTSNSKDHHWLSNSIATHCRRLGLNNWTAIQQQLCQFPWIFSLHEAPGRRFWENM
ncbi:uncharacterized protein N7511_004661 [Penicillium nucicola]|uniref:uncharacterized protein n=1 Tax=Penicillium nucicola TaxID=1850975 RepID=UPI0025453A06|nr:uncharacterized protein N7511_004661 [Penicillium nucicola]KAJ5767045.1 hypothetical protein N7511_004661 [Penicillium nucicola]